MEYRSPGSSAHGMSQAKIPRLVFILSSGRSIFPTQGFLNPGSSTLGGGILPLSHQGNTPKQHSIYLRSTSWLSYAQYQSSSLYSLRLFRTTLVIHQLIVSFPTILVWEDPTCWSVTNLRGHNSGAHVPKLEPVFSNKRNITMGRLCTIMKCTIPLVAARESPWSSMNTLPHQNKCNF